MDGQRAVRFLLFAFNFGGISSDIAGRLGTSIVNGCRVTFFGTPVYRIGIFFFFSLIILLVFCFVFCRKLSLR